jgi:hypothetical protein
MIFIASALASPMHVAMTITNSAGPTMYSTGIKRHSSGRCTVLTAAQKTQFHADAISKVAVIPRGELVDGWQYLNLIATSESLISSEIQKICQSIGSRVKTASSTLAAAPNTVVTAPEPLVSQIIQSGPSKNRIDVVFMGDGYTSSEQGKFDGDMRRLINDMFEVSTFQSYLPLFNIWTVFVPSEESGIGVNGTPKNTSFGLYRDGTELRAVYPAYPDKAREACKATGELACDYPTLIGNDDFYGGLGGEFVISTRSVRSGSTVLRHEMGHKY